MTRNVIVFHPSLMASKKPTPVSGRAPVAHALVRAVSPLMGTLCLCLFPLLTSCKKPSPKITVPSVFQVRFTTSQGTFIVEANKSWAPRGVDRFHELVRIKYFDQGRFFRVLKGFIAQFGVHRDFDVHDKWRKLVIPDDPFKEKNLRGTLAFAKSDPDTRSTEIFINLADNPALDDQKFVPFAKIVDGIDVIDKIYSGYGEMRPEGKDIDPGRVEGETNEYLVQHFPKMDYIITARFADQNQDQNPKRN
jgi:peptidyl-prolyl cis-trans isomerase A (cyclophilin A)